MFKVKDFIREIEAFAPLSLQESYDNSGLQVGHSEQEVKAVLLCIDCTEEVLEEAKEKQVNLIITHHPLIFGGLKKITGKTAQERIVMDAIRNQISIYAAHTNIDSVKHGVSGKMADLLNLKNQKILHPLKERLKKLVVFIPEDYQESVKTAIFEAGAGHIGNYSHCGFVLSGEGSFQPGKGTHPFVGELGQLHKEKEVRFETIFPDFLYAKVVNAMIKAHPYEEVAYDVYPVENVLGSAGLGIIGDLENPMDELTFLKRIKKIFDSQVIRHTDILEKPVRRVALCGGSGSSLLNDAIRDKADVFISADFKYHQFFDAEGKIVIADLGHYETEQFTKDIFYDLLIKKFSNFAIYLSEINSNPINYL